MTLATSRLWPVWIGLIAAGVMGPRSVWSQESVRYRESVSLNTDSAVSKKLEIVRVYLQEEEWSQALGLLQQIAENHQDTVVSVSPGRYVNAEIYCHMLIAGLPPQGLQAYRQRIDATARQWFEAGKSNRDEASIRRIIRHAFASSYGDDALWLLGEWAWERGDIATARKTWSRMLPTTAKKGADETLVTLNYPDTDFDPAEIRARLVLCRLIEGDLPQAAQEIQEFAQRHPDAQGTLAGKTGQLADILKSLAADARDWDFSPRNSDFETFASNRQRNKVLPQGIDDVGGILWSVPLPVQRLDTDDPSSASDGKQPLSYYPVVVKDTVFVSNSESVFAYDLQTGEPKWPAGPEDDAAIYSTAASLLVHRIQPLRPLIGVPRYTLTAHKGRVYARMGSPITGKAGQEIRDFPNELVGLDVEQGQGKPVWNVSSTEIEADGPAWSFEGAPLVADGRVYVALRRNHPQPEVNVACFDAETGKLLWNRNVCTAVTSLGNERNFVSHQLLTWAEDTIFYSTDLGAIAALNAEDGTIRWVVTYPTQAIDNPTTLNDHTEQGLTPCLYHQGTVIAAPTDSDALMAIDSQTGTIQWTLQLRGGVRHLLGVSEGILVVGGDRLWGIDIETGRSAWPHSYGTEDPVGHGYGRGILAGDSAYWPTREDILQIDLKTGRLRNRFDLKNRMGETGGNLAIADGLLLIAQPDRLVAFSEYAIRKQPMSFPISAILGGR